MRTAAWVVFTVLATAACSADQEAQMAPPEEGNELPPDVLLDDSSEKLFDLGLETQGAVDVAEVAIELDATVDDTRDATVEPDALRRDVAMDSAAMTDRAGADSAPRIDSAPRVDTAPRPDITDASSPRDAPAPRDTGPVPVPVPGSVRPGAECHALLRDLGVRFTVASATRGVEDPVTVTTPIEGVHYRYASYTAAERPLLMDCRLGVALVRLGRELTAHWDIDTVNHIGIYNYRVIAGTTRLSQHAHAMAIDIGGLRSRGGQNYSVLSDFVANGSPTCPPRASNARDRTLKEVACWMYSSRTLNIVLTPNYNSAHRNHFHVDLTPGSHFIGLEAPEGVDPEHNGLTDFLIDDD